VHAHVDLGVAAGKGEKGIVDLSSCQSEYYIPVRQLNLPFKKTYCSCVEVRLQQYLHVLSLDKISSA